VLPLEVEGARVILYLMKSLLFRRHLLAGALAAGIAAPVLAQEFPAPNYGVAATDPIDVLSAHLRTLAASPRNFAALIGAGDAALQIGDPNAALGFFARAEQLDPRSGKAKAGLASALVALERPNDALPLFAQAQGLGVPEAEIARDRGLAYDLRGDTKSAQRDYAMALRRNPDDETLRRYALSLGISGQRSEAMNLLEPLLRKKDQSAWRARAFILAMNGDLGGANSITRQVMPANLAAAMTPFLMRLATLNAADRAHAVNFGTMPSNGVQMASVQIGDPYKPIGGATVATGGPASSIGSRGFTTPGAGRATGTGLIPAGEPLGPKPVRVAPALPPPAPALAAAPRTTPAPAFPGPAAPGFSIDPVAPPPSVQERFGTRVARIGPVDPAKLPPEARTPEMSTAVVVKDLALPRPTAAPPRAPEPVAEGPALAASAPASAALKPVVVPPVEEPRFEVAAAAPAPVAAAPKVIAEIPPTTATAAPVLATTAIPPAVSPAPIVEAGLPPSTVATALGGLIGPPAPEGIAVAGAVAPAVVTAEPVAVPAVVPPITVAPAPEAPAPATSRLASVLAGVTPESEATVVALPTAAEIRARRRLVQKKAEAAAALATAAQTEKDAKAAEASAAAAKTKANPARLWVQVATGANTRGLSGTWARIRDGNATALKGKSAYSVPFKATNRLIVGPVKSTAEARALVNALAKGGVAATTYSSDAGQEVARVGAK
jgi:tetratricopeptide (TPR) repeat protein